MFKMFGWLGRTVAAGLILSFLCIWTTGYIVNGYVESLLKQYNLPLEVQPMALSGVWGKLWGADPVKPAGEEPKAADQAEKDSGSTAADTGEGSNAAADAASASDNSGAADVPGDGSQAADGGSGAPAAGTGGTSSAGGSDQASGDAAADSAGSTTGGSAAGDAAADSTGSAADSAAASGTVDPLGQDDPNAAVPVFGSETVVTPDDMIAAKEQMSQADKDKLFALLTKRLPLNELQNISTYVENGLTETELSDVQQIVAKYLKDDEYAQMMAILKKY